MWPVVFLFWPRHDLVFLQESVEPDESFGDVGDLAENLEDDQRPGAFALREVDLAHTAAAYLLDAAVTPDDDRAEAVKLREIRMGSPPRLVLFLLAGRAD